MENWNDITSRFREECSNLKPGELASTSDFRLQDSIAALELMDPKMDAGLHVNAKIGLGSLSEAIQLGLKMHEIPIAEVLGIMDDIVMLYVTWLQGNSLALTVYTCVYLHDVNKLENIPLKGFCMSILKIIALTIDTIMRSDVYDEEDIQLARYGFTMQDDKTADEVIELCRNAEASIGKVFPNESLDLRVALSHRLKFVGFVMQIFKVSPKTSNIQKSQKLIEKAKQELDSILSTIALGTQMETEAAVKPFERYINSHLLTPTPPKKIDFISRAEAYEYLKKEVTNIAAATTITSCNSLKALQDFFKLFCRRSPGILSRSHLFMIFINLSGAENGRSLEEMVTEASLDYHFQCPELQKALAAGDQDLCPILDFYHKQCSDVFHELFKIYCKNRARQWRKIAKFFQKLHTFASQAHDVTVAVKAVWCSRGKDVPYSPDFRAFSHRITLELSVQYFLLGFDIGIFAMHEYHMVWYYLDYLFGWIKQSLSDSILKREASMNAGNGGAVQQQGTGKKKKKKQTDKKTARKAQNTKTLKDTLVHFEALRFMVKGFLLVSSGALLAELIPTCNEFKFTSLETLYNHRFAPMSHVDFPPVSNYEVYETSTSLKHVPNIQHTQVYARAVKHFEEAAGRISTLLSCPVPPSPEQKTDLEALLKVAKTNIVTTRLAVAQPDSKKPLQFDFSVHGEHPVIRYR
eukprot:m.61862 g.61862  ORF g.61862 m.61862 type:complete len:693 (-) comp11458_c0_seq1:68-2146(-)